jgi:integrase/recombinase XerD
MGHFRAKRKGRAPAEHTFLNRCGQPITRFGIHSLVERYDKKASISTLSLKTKRVSPHSIRHTTATHLLRSGVEHRPGMARARLDQHD